MSAFACMYFQEPSLLAFQRRLHQQHQRSNLQTMFAVEEIPKDTQLRSLLDRIPGEILVAPIFKDYHERLRRHKHLDTYEIEPGLLMCSIDGTQYHSSKQVHCSQCLSKRHRNGDITWSHGVLQGAIMHPDKKQVLPVMPEAIRNTDGEQKQDCESKAAKRFILNLRKAHPRQGFLLNGDGLMSHQPMIEAVLDNDMHYLFTAKPGDHKYMMEWLSAYSDLPSLEYRDKQGRIHQYRWQHQIPLRDGDDTIKVNWFDYKLINQKDRIGYHSSWVTDLNISEDNVEHLARAGRCRWKIENECFNTLKNQGYYLEHNYGHGRENLSYNLYLLTLLAFYYHQIFELTDGLYQACRQKYGPKYEFWARVRARIELVVMESWERLLAMLLHPDKWVMVPQKIR